MSDYATEQQTLEGIGQRRLWSVTTLLKMGLGTGPGLVNWHCEQTAIAAVDRRSTVDAMIKDVGREQTIKWLVKERWSNVERAQVRGTNVHKWAEAVALGVEPPELEPHEIPYGEQLARWFTKWRPEFVLAEAPVYNVEHAYAGTCDGIMRLQSKKTGDWHRFIFDYKTTEKGPDAKSRPPYSETPLQIAAYRYATEVGVIAEQRYDGYRQRYYIYDESVEHQPMPEVDGGLAIIVSPVDCYAVPTKCGPSVFKAWLHVIEAARWQDETWRNVYRPPLDNVPEPS